MQRGVNRAVAVYARTATDDDAGSECDRQIRAARKVVDDELDVYADVARSETDATRPELRRLIEAARAGHVGRVLIRDLSRLARDAGLLARILEPLEAAGVVVETIEEKLAHA